MAVTVDGVEIPETAIQEEMQRMRPEYTEYVQREGGEPNETQLRQWALENLIENALFLRAAVASQPVPSEARIQQELETHASMYQNMPEAERPRKAQETMQQRRLMREIRKGVKPPSEEELKAYYDANPKQFVAPEAIRLSHICLYVSPATRPDAFLELLRIRSELEQNRLVWGEAVQRFSDSFSKDSGFFATVVRGELPPDIETQLFALKENELSDVIDFGQQTLHLFRAEARLPPGPVSFDDIKEHLTGALFEQACQDAMNAKFDELKASAVIEGMS